MKKKRISVLEWESVVNTLAITDQENKYLDVLANDSLQSMKDTGKEKSMKLLLSSKNMIEPIMLEIINDKKDRYEKSRNLDFDNYLCCTCSDMYKSLF